MNDHHINAALNIIIIVLMVFLMISLSYNSTLRSQIEDFKATAEALGWIQSVDVDPGYAWSKPE